MAVATAAPVIALANTVTILDITNTWFSTMKRKRNWSTPPLLYFFILVVSIVNLVSQATVFYAALKSLALGRDFDSVGPVIGFVSAGIIYVLLAVILDVSLRYILSWDVGADKKRVTLWRTSRRRGTTGTRSSPTGLGWPPSDHTGTKPKK